MKIIRILLSYLKKAIFPPLTLARKAGVVIGENTKLVDNPNWGSEPYLISIGCNTLISGGVSFINHDYSVRVFKNLGRNLDVTKYARIRIGSNCFIGAKSIIMMGVNIGDNSIIAAGAVVTKDVPPNEVWGGYPQGVLLT